MPQILLFTTLNAEAYSSRLVGIQANINDVVSWNVADWTSPNNLAIAGGRKNRFPAVPFPSHGG